MIAYLVNFTLCSALLLTAYHFLLKGKAIYQFNRFYLLFSLLFSLAVPLIDVQHTIAPLPYIKPVQEEFVMGGLVMPDAGGNTAVAVHSQTNYLLYAVITVYALVTLLLLIRFIKNMYTIRSIQIRNESINYKGAKLVLIKQELTPHTFLRYIFLNKDAWHTRQIENEVLQHELAHARQHHSADIILIELVIIFCWFNPLLLFYRRAMQLNHEFIADDAVLNADYNVTVYQHLLLSKLGQTNSLAITSRFNYSITKKRLIMMTKTTSTAAAWVSRLVIVPVMAAAFILFCNKTAAQEPAPATKTKKEEATEKAPAITKMKTRDPVKVIFGRPGYPSTKEGISQVELNEYITFENKYTATRMARSKKMTKQEEQRLEQLYKRMSPEQQSDRYIGFSYPPDMRPQQKVSQAILDSWKDPAVYGVWIDDKRVKNADLQNRQPSEFNGYYFSRLTPYAVKNDKFHYQVGLMTIEFYKKFREEEIANRNKSMIWYRKKMSMSE